MADDLTTPPPSYEKVDLESVMVTPTAPPLYPVLPLAESPLPLGVWSVCVFLSCVSILWEHFLFVCLYIHVWIYVRHIVWTPDYISMITFQWITYNFVICTHLYFSHCYTIIIIIAESFAIWLESPQQKCYFSFNFALTALPSKICTSQIFPTILVTTSLNCFAGNDIGDSPASIVMAGFLSPTLVSPTPVASPSQLYKSHSDYNMQRVSVCTPSLVHVLGLSHWLIDKSGHVWSLLLFV